MTIEKSKHHKHPPLTRPSMGEFGRNEVAIMGTPCGRIKHLAGVLSEHFSDRRKVAFVDADHKATEMEGALKSSAFLAYTDKINFGRFDFQRQFDRYKNRVYFNDCDLVLVNGNHFKAARQILVIDPKKSLERKLEHISDVLLVITLGSEPIPSYLEPFINNVPVADWEDLPSIIRTLETWLDQNTPTLKGLILAGGRSQRMKQDKGALKYHGVNQRQHLYGQLRSLDIPSWVSCRPDQKALMEEDLPLLTDSFSDLGPMGALLSAFRLDPESAWLAVACDLPYLTDRTLQYLREHRDPSKIATAFNSPLDEFPEPLITIWEPKSYLTLLQFMNQGYSCPRKVLINSDVALLDAPHPKELSNINHPHEYQEALRELSG